MQPQRLKESVLVSGFHGPLGLTTDLVLKPVDLPGWSVQFASMREDNLKTPLWRGALLHRSVPSRIDLSFDVDGRNRAMRVVEHLLALREGMGLYDGVLVVLGRRGIPFTGHAGHFLKRVEPALAPAKAQPQCWTTPDTVGPIKTANGRGSLEFIPSNTGVLRLVVSIDYPEIGPQEFTWESNKNTFGDVAWTRGELKPMFRPWVHLSEHVGWPHAWAFADATRIPRDEWASHVVRHRALDLLGELALVCKAGKLSGTCYCHRAGHYEALQLVRKMRQALVEVRMPVEAAAE